MYVLNFRATVKMLKIHSLSLGFDDTKAIKTAGLKNANFKICCRTLITYMYIVFH